MLHGAGIFTNIHPHIHPNVGKHSIHGAYGDYVLYIVMCIYILYTDTPQFLF